MSTRLSANTCTFVEFQTSDFSRAITHHAVFRKRGSSWDERTYITGILGHYVRALFLQNKAPKSY